MMETIEYQGHRLHRWQCGPSTFLARPEAGARLMNWNIRMSDGMVRDVIHWPEHADFASFAKVRGGNPILFPFSGRSFHRGAIGQWRDPSGAVRPMPQNGFARTSDFRLVDLRPDGFTAELIPDEAAREAYPFDYRFTVRYEFELVSLRVFLELENLGESPLPWSAGHHFYFALPWHPQLSRGDYRFKLPARKVFRHAPDGSLELIKGAPTEDSFAAPEASDRIYSRLKSDCAVFGPKGGEEDVGIRILGGSTCYSTWNAFLLWTEKNDSPFYCVEPWMGPPNSVEHKKGLHFVEPGGRASFGVEVSLL